MALGIPTETSSADFLPRIKYDARAGRFFKIDREQDTGGSWSSAEEELPVPAMSKFAMDLENIEVGWAKFTGGVDFQMVPLGTALPPQPSPDHRRGFRIKIYTKGLGVRHWNHQAKCVLQAMDVLHDVYLAERAAHAGQIPVVAIDKTVPIISGQGAKQSTNYAPVMRIETWIPRPEGMIADAANVAAAPPAQSAINGNGAARQVAPPEQRAAAAQAKPAMAASGVEF